MKYVEFPYASRGEAKVAKLLASRGEEALYEPWFIVGLGEKFLPDFYIPRRNVYLECKTQDFWYEGFKGYASH